MLKVLEHLLVSRPIEQPEYPAYNEAVKELLTDTMYEIQRLATKMPDQLLVRTFLLNDMTVLTFFRRFTINSNQKSTRSFRL